MSLISTEILWQIILDIRTLVCNTPLYDSPIIINFTADKYTIVQADAKEINDLKQGIIISNQYPENEKADCLWMVRKTEFEYTVAYNHLLDNTELQFFTLYLPNALASLAAKKIERSITFLHFAQTLDGRIATDDGHSKWISNNENLIHSHRLRALCDAILIGANTLRIDRPSLTVRHVDGPTPIKVVIGNTDCKFESLLANNGDVLFLTTGTGKNSDLINKVYFEEEFQTIQPSAILKALFERGINSIFIEGGSYTASTFLKNKMLDYLQLYIAPKLFGSGVNNFNLPVIHEVDDSVKFTHSSFLNMGNGILFNGIIDNAQ